MITSDSLTIPTECKSDTLHALFAVPVLSCVYEAEHSSELNFISNLDFSAARPKYPEISVNTFVLNSPELINIRRFIESKIEYFAKNVMSYDRDLIITQSWVNRQQKNAGHHEHQHPHSVISGVWYPTNSENLNPIIFRSPAPFREIHAFDDMRRWDGTEPSDFGQIFSASQVQVKGSSSTSAGLLLFPSNLRHYVYCNPSDSLDSVYHLTHGPLAAWVRLSV